MGLVADSFAARLVRLAEERNKLLKEIRDELVRQREATSWPQPPRQQR